ncbi:MAG: valine--tRNA ligase [Candidatus Paceibacterota bacterium]|jgi:valyl-tRNA synthetase
MIKVKYMQELPKSYDPKQVEGKIYGFWEKSGFFNPDKLPAPKDEQKKNRKKPYTIVIPPPNVTGSLHMGHALQHTIHDILIRRKRMQGFKTLWLPGTDHAGIATQRAVEKELKKEGKTKFDLGKEEFIKRVWQWKETYGNKILDQLKKLGSSCDWSRTRFTMDKEYSEAVNEAFMHYYKKGWIYRGKRVVNWCVGCRTSLSDLEIEFSEEKGHLWYIKYPVGDSEEFIVVATTRPETMLGDTAVAVNPKDERYKNFVGKRARLPLTNREIPIIEDRLVDKGFGTGAVKVTPAHDLNDAEIGQRHSLEAIQVIDERGRMSQNAPAPYQGLSVLEAREKIVADLRGLGLLEKIEDYLHQVPKCYRCNSTIELIPSEQWFLKMGELAKLAKNAVKSGKTKFAPKRWEKVYLDWMNNIKDWCISRQIWWGHKIPVEGSEDVLDTWFSSALWPFAAMGWPKNTDDLKNFYPTDTLCTARDIINLWVSRMIFSSLEFMKDVPFKTVLIHPTVLTRDGKRMSKSLGTGIDPLELCERYGADATRFGLTWHLTGNQDIRFIEDNIVMGKKFCNKIWNASRFVMMQLPGEMELPKKISAKIPTNKEIIKALEKTVASLDKSLDSYEFGQAARTLYNFFWHDFCDVYIEKAKNQSDEETKKTLLYTLSASLKMLHPFVPFITEEIYQILPIKNRGGILMVENWPKK